MADPSVRQLGAQAAEYYNCRLMPHGGKVLLPIVLSTLGLCASLVGDGCDYARLRGASVALLAGSSAVPYVDAGMAAYRVPNFYPAENVWRVAYSQGCAEYARRDLLVDPAWRAAEWLRFLSLVAGGTAGAFLWTGSCLTLRRHHWRAAGAGVALAAALQACSFVWFHTRLCRTSATSFENFEAGREAEGQDVEESTCEMFFGSKCSITACVFYAAAAAAMLCRKYPAPVPRLVVEEEREERKVRRGPPGPGIISTTGRWSDPKYANSVGSGSGRRSARGGGEASASWHSGSGGPIAAGQDHGMGNSLSFSQRVSLLSSDGTAGSRLTGHSSNRPMKTVRPNKDAPSHVSAVSFV